MGYPVWYWSSTPYRDYPAYVDSVRFSDGNESWYDRDNLRLSCHPGALVAGLGSIAWVRPSHPKDALVI